MRTPVPHEPNESRELQVGWVSRILDSEPRVGPVRLVCIDGPAGSGKTTLASELATALHVAGPTPAGAAVVHGDEIYEGWDVVASAPDRVAAFGLLPQRISAWLLDPWREGRAGRHPVWDWYADAWGPDVEVPAAPVVILEGVGLGAAALRELAALSLWVEADPDIRLARVLARDGEQLHAAMLGWQRDEDRWHQLDRTRECVDVRLTAQ